MVAVFLCRMRLFMLVFVMVNVIVQNLYGCGVKHTFVVLRVRRGGKVANSTKSLVSDKKRHDEKRSCIQCRRNGSSRNSSTRPVLKHVSNKWKQSIQSIISRTDRMQTHNNHSLHRVASVEREFFSVLF